MLDRNGIGQSQKGRQTEGDLTFYWQYYGLNQDPFPAVLDENVYFPIPHWEQHFDLLQHLLNNENVLLALIGGEGAGKTTFAVQFCQLFNDNYYLHRFEADSLFSTRKLVRELDAGFDLKAPINESPEEQLDAQISEVQHKDRTCLLVIDDAHFLPLETINSLLFLLKQQSRNQMRLHIILFGDKNLQAKLSSLAKHERSSEIIHTVELEPLTLEETKQYLDYRLNRAGLTGEFPFSQINVERIYANSDGIPDKINIIAQQILLEQLKKQNEQAESSMFKRHQTKIIGGCLLVVVLIAASYVLNKEGQLSNPQNSEAAISFANQSQSIAPPLQPNTVVVATNPSQNDNNQTAAVSNVNNNTQNTLANPSSDQANTVPVQVTPQPSNPSSLSVKQSNPVKHKKHLVSKIPPVAPEAEKLMQMADQVKQLAEPVSYSKSVSTRVSKLSHSNVVKAKSTAKSEATHLNLSKNAGDFTLQILGLSDEKAMQNFIHRNKLQAHAHYIKSTLNGKPWFVLVYGNYKTRQEALNAIASLSATLRKYQPWPRTLASTELG